jgi:hypothetical protein
MVQISQEMNLFVVELPDVDDSVASIVLDAIQKNKIHIQFNDHLNIYNTNDMQFTYT